MPDWWSEVVLSPPSAVKLQMQLNGYSIVAFIKAVGPHIENGFLGSGWRARDVFCKPRIRQRHNQSWW